MPRPEGRWKSWRWEAGGGPIATVTVRSQGWRMSHARPSSHPTLVSTRLPSLIRHETPWNSPPPHPPVVAFGEGALYLLPGHCPGPHREPASGATCT